MFIEDHSYEDLQHFHPHIEDHPILARLVIDVFKESMSTLEKIAAAIDKGRLHCDGCRVKFLVRRSSKVDGEGTASVLINIPRVIRCMDLLAMQTTDFLLRHVLSVVSSSGLWSRSNLLTASRVEQRKL